MLFHFTRYHIWNENKKALGAEKFYNSCKNFLDYGYVWNKTVLKPF